MKRLLSLIAFALVLGPCALVLPALRAAQGIKDLTLAGNTTNTSTQSNSAAHTFLTGASATFNAGSTLTLNGALAGTPTGGTLNLSALTLTLGAQSGASLTNLNATNLASGTLAAARMPALTGDVTTSVGTVATTVAKLNGVALSGLATGILKNTTTTGAPSIAVAGDFPTLNQSTTGSAATLTTGRTLAITGDLAYTSPSFNGSANVTAAGTLATVNSNVGSFGGAATVGTFTVNAKGLVTAAGNTTIAIPATAISDSTSTGRSVVTGTTQTANTLFAGPASGSAAAPAFRALVQADLPDVIKSFVGADYLQSDGATSNRRIETVYGALGALAGSDWTYVGEPFDVPTSDPATTVILASWTTIATASADTGVFALSIGYNGTGLFVIQYGATTADRRLFLYNGWRAAFSGRRLRLIVAFTGNSTTVPVVYQEGINISASFAETSLGTTVPNWAASSVASTYFVQGVSAPAGYFRPGRPVNRKFAQSDVDFVQLTGRLAAADAAGGSAVNRLTGDNSTFASAGNWILNVGATVSGGKLNIPAGGNASNTLAAHIAGRRYRMVVTVDSLTAGTVDYNSGNGGGTVTAVAGTITVEYTASGTTPLHLYATGGNAVIDNVAHYELGALSDPIIQPCQVLDDATPNNRASILVGFTPITNRKGWRIPAFVDMSTTGNKQLLAGAVFDAPTKQAIDTIETTCAGSPTFSIGDGTTATKYTASVAHSAGRLRETVSANFPADSAKTGFYANVTSLHASSTAELIVIRGHRE